MNIQISLSALSDELSQAKTKKKEFWEQMDRIIPWGEWIGIEHVFGIVKGPFGYRKTRYKDRRKQSAKLHMMFALANLILADRRFGLDV